MTRVKRGIISNKSRKNTLSKTKGYRFGRSTKEREAKVAIAKAGVHAFAHRRDKKNDFRRLWNVRISAGLHEFGLSYSKFIGALKKANIELDRKILSNLAKDDPKTFAQVVAAVK
jgi:large subunit ribosomal protein L20